VECGFLLTPAQSVGARRAAAITIIRALRNGDSSAIAICGSITMISIPRTGLRAEDPRAERDDTAGNLIRAWRFPTAAVGELSARSAGCRGPLD